MIFFLLMLLMPITAHAGMDFTGLSGNKAMTINVPEFKDYKHAKEWANLNKNNPYVVDVLRKRIEHVEHRVRDILMEDTIDERDVITRAGRLVDQNSLNRVAFNIVDQAMVGSSFQASSIPVHRDGR